MWLSELRALSLEERQVFDATRSFIEGRLNQRDIFEWALKLNESQDTERLAVRSLLVHRSNKHIKAPWFGAWTWLIEMWTRAAPSDRQGLGKHAISDRVTRGERSATLLEDMSELVRPWVEVEARSHWGETGRKGRVSNVRDLVALRMTSGDLVRPAELGLGEVGDIDFLCALADKLDALVCEGLHLGRRIGWNEKRGLWMLGDLGRAYFVDPAEIDEDRDEPDQFHRGIAPAVKLLGGVVLLIAARKPAVARKIISRWFTRNDPVHIRMWAAAARSGSLASAKEAYAFLVGATLSQFWDQNSYPEISELRAVRFREFTTDEKARIIAKLLRRPPSSHWRSTLEADRQEAAQEFWTLRELRRIELASGVLPPNATEWMRSRLQHHPEIAAMSRVTEGFEEGPLGGFIPSRADFRFDELSDDVLLRSLNEALAKGYFADANESAHDWLRLEGRAQRVIAALQATSDHGAAYAHVWETLGWTLASGKHLAPPSPDEKRYKQELGSQVVHMLLTLPKSTTASAINGIAHWLLDWGWLIAPSPAILDLAGRLWPLAAEATNRRHEEGGEEREGRPNQSGRDPYEQMRVDAVASPAGQLAGLFGNLCPSVRPGDRPFEANVALAVLRDRMASADGYAGLLARYIFVRNLAWHLAADPVWAERTLVAPLLGKEASSLPYWHALSGLSTIYRTVMVAVGERQAEVASDRRLSANVRAALAQKLAYSTLFDYWESRPLAVSEAVIQQMLRSVDDYVRSEVADVPRQFLKARVEKPKDVSSGTLDPALVYFRAVRPFFQKIWPLELSLATPSVAKALAILPASCGSAFVDAYALIERFIVPFEIWTLMDFGIVHMDGAVEHIVGISDADQARAILSLVDRSIGYADNARVPFDLHYLLDHILKIAPVIEGSRTFERLQALTRR